MLGNASQACCSSSANPETMIAKMTSYTSLAQQSAKTLCKNCTCQGGAIGTDEQRAVGTSLDLQVAK
jgi:hypothetical protein